MNGRRTAGWSSSAVQGHVFDASAKVGEDHGARLAGSFRFGGLLRSGAELVPFGHGNGRHRLLLLARIHLGTELGALWVEDALLDEVLSIEKFVLDWPRPFPTSVAQLKSKRTASVSTLGAGRVSGNAHKDSWLSSS